MNLDEIAAKGKPIERGLRSIIGKYPNWSVGIAFVLGALVVYFTNRVFG